MIVVFYGFDAYM
jgi:hypothetical protein